MGWIDRGYDLVGDRLPSIAREIKNSKSSFEHRDFVITKAISEMVEDGAASVLSRSVRPTVTSPLGVVSESNSENLLS